jgi:hypothetical protein
VTGVQTCALPIYTGETGETGNGDECADGYDTDHEDRAAAPCDPGLPWVDVSAGLFATCGVKEGGCVQCWGDPTAYFVIPDLPFRTVRLSNYGGTMSTQAPHVCGLTLDGAIKCWGGEEKYGANDSPVGEYASLGTGEFNAVAVRSDGRLEQWGYLDACLDGPYVAVAATESENAAIRDDGTLEIFFTMEAIITVEGSWSSVSNGGAWVCGIRADRDNAVVCVSTVDGSEDPPFVGEEPVGRYVSTCASPEGFACALDEAGEVACWPAASPLSEPAAGPFTAITCGYSHASGLTADGEIRCWGYDTHGETIPPS